jgi:hypothetical protein
MLRGFLINCESPITAKFKLVSASSVRMENNPFVILGLIAELSVVPKFRVVGEFDGENTIRRFADTSALLGYNGTDLWLLLLAELWS